MMRQTLSLFCAGLLCIMLMAGCASKSKKEEIQDADLIELSYQAADNLLQRAHQHDSTFYTSKPLLVASFVNIDDVQRSSTLGRIIAEQVSSRFAQQGYTVIEVKLRSESVFVRGNDYTNRTGEGEFVLSRELQDISFQHDAHAVIVGTYAESRNTVYVTTKVIRVDDGVVLSSYDYSLPIGPDTKRMLRGQRRL